MYEKCPIGTVDEMLGCVFLMWSTGDEVYHSLRQSTKISEQGRLSIEKWFGIEHLEALHDLLNAVRASHAIPPFIERNPWPLQRFCLKMFHIDCKVIFLQLVLNKITFFLK